MHYLIGLIISGVLSLSPSGAASVKTTQVVVAPQVIMMAKPKPAEHKAQPYMIIKMNEAQVTSY